MALLMFCQYMQKVTETDARIGNLDKRKISVVAVKREPKKIRPTLRWSGRLT